MLLTPLLELFHSKSPSTLYIGMCQLSSYEVDLARWEKIDSQKIETATFNQVVLERINKNKKIKK